MENIQINGSTFAKEASFNKEALIRRADSFVSNFNIYPIIPEGDQSFDFIKNVLKFDPLYRLSQLKSELLEMLMDKTDYEYSKADFDGVIEESYGKCETELMQNILNWLIKCFKKDTKIFSYLYSDYISLRPHETLIFYYAYSIYYIGKKLKNGEALLFARTALMALDVFHCERNTIPYVGIRGTGKMLSLNEFRNDAQLYQKIINMIEVAIEQLPNKDIKKKLREAKVEEKRARGRKRIKAILNVLLRIAMTLCFPILLKYASSFFDITEFDSWIPVASAAVLMFSALCVNIKCKNLILAIFLNVLFAALLYPACMVVSFAAIGAIFLVIAVCFGFWGVTKS